MATFATPTYTAQAAGLLNGAAMADGNKTAETLCIARVGYTLLGTETTGDVINLVKLGPGCTVEPALSSYYGADPGTTLTGTVGVSGDADAYSSALTLSAGGLQRFVPTTPPAELLVPTLISFTVASDSTLTPGVVLYFDIAYTVRH